MRTFLSRPAILSAILLAILTVLFTQNLSATVVVGTCRNLTQFATIQAAVDAVPAGTTIDICPGTYAEQIHINKSLTLRGVASGAADSVVIVSPAGGLKPNATSFSTGNPITAHVAVLGPATVDMSNLAVDSQHNGQSGCGSPTLIGILYQNANGTLNHIVTRNQWIGASESDTTSNGCETGLGIFVQSGDGGTSNVTVANSSVHDYQKNGITGNETGTTITVNGNEVAGQGPTNGAAENGIQIGFGAGGTVTGNNVIDDVFAPDTISDPADAASGILLYDAQSNKTTVQNNTVGNAQFGIAAVTDTAGEGDGAVIASNRVFSTHVFDGVEICVNGSTVRGNAIRNSSRSAVHLDASCPSTGNNNTVTGNTIVEACTGILADTGTGGNTISPNTFYATEQTNASSCAAPSSDSSATVALRTAASSRNASNRRAIRP